MARQQTDEQTLLATVQAYEEAGGDAKRAAKALGMHHGTVYKHLKKARDQGLTTGRIVEADTAEPEEEATDKLTEQYGEDKGSITYIGPKFQTAEEVLAHCQVDMSIWEIEKKTVNTWEVTGKRRVEGADDIWSRTNMQIKVQLRRKLPQLVAVEKLLDDIASARPVRVARKRPKAKAERRLALEISIMDPHMGLHCFTPQSDHQWDMDTCEQFYLFACEELCQQAAAIGEIEEIHWVFGNDFNHVDNVFHTTSAGTPQPEGVSHHEALLRGEKLAISAADLLMQYAPVRAYQIPGNHDRVASYMQGRILQAYFRNDDNFEIDASSSPYKKFRYGASLVGLEHGHSVRAASLPALMANEWRFDWAETHYHEWHLGDQHRKGTSKPSSFEEQGVSIEYLAGLVAPNEWHRLKGFNFQKRAANGFVWDYDCGQTNRLTVNISKYTGRYLGTRYDEWLKRQGDHRAAAS